MWFSMICLALIGAITFFQSIHGLLSSLIFLILTLLSTALAFGLYELVAIELLADWKPDFALAIALAACFAIPLTVGRFALDSLIRRSNLIPLVLDKVGAVFCGLWTALIIVGVMATAMQMLPFGDRGILGFSRFTRPAEESKTDYEESSVWLNPDRFAVRMAIMLSDGVFSGQKSFASQHPDLITEVGWSQVVNAEAGVFAKPADVQINPVDPASGGSPIKLTDYVYTKTSVQNEIGFEPVDPKPDHEFWVLNFTPPSEESAADGTVRVAMRQIRMVGQDHHDDPVEYYPIAIRDSDQPDKHARVLEQGDIWQHYLFKSWEPGADGSIEVVFEIRKGFSPHYLTYKSLAHAVVEAPSTGDLHHPRSGDEGDEGDEGDADGDSKVDETPEASATDEQPAAPTGGGSSASSTSPPAASNDRVSGVRAKAGKSFMGDEMPITLTDYHGAEIEGFGEFLDSGHVIGNLVDQGEKDTKRNISRFKVPEDKALLQLSVRALKARSTLGGALNFAVRNIRNYLITDSGGEKYEMIGQYAIATVNGVDVIEVQYFPEQIGSIGRGVRDFEEIKQRHLEDANTTIVYLFLINKGRKAVSFSTGRGQTDLTGENLVAE